MRLFLLFLGVLSLGALGCETPQKRASARAVEVGTQSIKALDADLSDYAYPYEVKTFEVRSQGQALKMRYMDVAAPKDKAHGKTVVLLHGKNFSGAYWGSTIKALNEAGWRVIAPDQVGFGKSSKPVAYQYSFHQLAHHTHALLGALKVDRAVIVGHSMGGMLATRFVLMYPKVASKLVLINPIGLEDWKLKIPYQTIDQWYANELKKTPEGVKAYMTKNYFDGKWKPAYQPLLEIQAGWAKGPDREKTAKVSALTYDMILTQPVLYEFPTIKTPTLLIIGTRDRTALGKPLVSEAVRKTMGQYQILGQQAAAAIPGAKLVTFDDVGHIPHYEVYDQTIKALRSFLSE